MEFSTDSEGAMIRQVGQERDGEDRRSAAERRSAVLGALSLFAAALVGLLQLFADSLSYSAVSVNVLLAVVLGLAYLAAMYLMARYVFRQRQADLRVAVTGLPCAGKTVFSIALFDALMSERPDGIRFTGSSKTVISVYQAIRGIGAGEWPMSTRKGFVERYEGRIRVGRRLVIDLEWGDSAGEYWASLGSDDKDESYLSYAVSSQAIAHVISAEWLGGSAQPCWDRGEYDIRTDLNDLLMCSRLIRLQSTNGRPIPLVVVVSKMDLLGLGEHEDLFKVIPLNRLHSTKIAEDLRALQSGLWETLLEFGGRLEDQFLDVSIVFSAVSASLVGSSERLELAEWLAHATLPLRQTGLMRFLTLLRVVPPTR
ncbi:MAG: hypothetical protein LCH82_12520 [Actinobacteria bacterium]|nr:hypothetical protein [Actinomycetota bacterium]